MRYKNIQEKNFTLPVWLERYRISDTLLARAYDDFGSSPRALVKTAIALAHQHFSNASNYVLKQSYNPDTGFLTYTSLQPADWTILIFSGSFSAAALAASAAILPVICGVQNIIAICISKKPSPALLASLELCGIEDIFLLDLKLTLEALNEFSGNNGSIRNKTRGSCVYFYQNQNGEAIPQSLTAFPSSLVLQIVPHIFMEAPDLLDKNLLRVLLGDYFQEFASPSGCHTIYVKNEQSFQNFEQFDAPLILTPECAGFWLFPQLSLNFFKYKKSGFSTGAGRSGI